MVEQVRSRPSSSCSGPLGANAPRPVYYRCLGPTSANGTADNNDVWTNIGLTGPHGPPKSQNEANCFSGRAMTSFRQIEANRRNARHSTGPLTQEGKQ